MIIQDKKKTKSRIAYISFDFRFLSIHCLETIQGLQAAGYPVELYVPYDVIIDSPSPLKCTIHRITFLDSHNPMVRLVAFTACLLEALLRDWRCENRPDFIYSRYSFMGFPSVMLGRVLNIPYIAEVNGITAASAKKGENHRRLVKRNAEKAGLKLADGLVVPSMHLKRQIISQYRVSPERLHVISNGFNPKIFFPDKLRAKEFRERAGFDTKDFIVGFVGSLGEWQGLSIFKAAIGKILSCKELSDIKFLLAGDYVADSDLGRLKGKGGSGRHSIEQFIQNQGLSNRVIYLGHVSYESSADVMRACDILVAPYSREYLLRGGGAPMKLYAYLGCKKPVIISDLGDFTEATALRRENAAILIAPESPEELASAIKSLYRDPVQRSLLAASGRRFAIRQRTWKHTCHRISFLFQRIVRQHSDR